MPVTVLLTAAGLQVPVIGVPFVDDSGNTGANAPLHIVANALNVGTIDGAVIVCTIVVVKAH